MGVFTRILGGGKDKGPEKRKKIPWIPLNALDQLPQITERSHERPQVIFKHSTTCGISRMVMNMFVNSYDLEENQIDLYYLDLLAYREVSNETGYHFQVLHQSPQLLVIRDGAVMAHASHGAISDIDLHQYQ